MHKKNGPKFSRQEKAVICLIGGLGSGIAIGTAIGFTVWSPLEGLAFGLALGSGTGGVPATLYYFGNWE